MPNCISVKNSNWSLDIVVKSMYHWMELVENCLKVSRTFLESLRHVTIRVDSRSSIMALVLRVSMYSMLRKLSQLVFIFNINYWRGKLLIY